MATLDLLGTVMALAAQFMIEREKRGEAVNEQDFRAWLQGSAIPTILDQSGEIFRTVVSAKAQSHEQFARIDGKLEEIRALVAGSGPYTKLVDLDRLILRRAFELARDATSLSVDDVDLATMASERRVDLSELRRSASFLSEGGFGTHRDYRSVQSFVVSPKGLLRAWNEFDPVGLTSYKAKLRDELPKSPSTARVAELAARVGAPKSLVHGLLCDWRERGLLSYKEYDGDQDGLLFGVSEGLVRELASDVIALVRE
ncbi:hypothetical protein C7S18_23760 (plasmid) [Ahniella affigens]|uniref:Uncharacterized protein n=1 Tax=Ahniella affigens TaxID=2021234 RepID=A0A2P1PZQ7_9GAMM|nr:hypothetical protein [Ahniella affigens]AVQ00317.1 hypothetical protein C7S18_23760 [Ahniella affigens]